MTSHLTDEQKTANALAGALYALNGIIAHFEMNPCDFDGDLCCDFCNEVGCVQLKREMVRRSLNGKKLEDFGYDDNDPHLEDGEPSP